MKMARRNKKHRRIDAVSRDLDVLLGLDTERSLSCKEIESCWWRSQLFLYCRTINWLIKPIFRSSLSLLAVQSLSIVTDFWPYSVSLELVQSHSRYSLLSLQKYQISCTSTEANVWLFASDSKCSLSLSK